MNSAWSALLAVAGYAFLNFSIIAAMWVFFPEVRKRKY